MALLAGGGSAQLVRDVGTAGAVQGQLAAGELAGARLSTALPFLARLQAGDGIAQAAQGVAVVTGNLAATEVEFDSAAINGVVIVGGDVAATEVEFDSIAISGSVLVSGDLASTEGDLDSAAIFGGAVVAITGDLVSVETEFDTAVISGGVIISGAVDATEVGTDSLISVGIILINGVVTVTEPEFDSLTSSGSVLVQGSLAGQEIDNDQSLLEGFLSASANGDLAAVEFGIDTAAFSGIVPAQGILSAQEFDNDTFSAVGSLPIIGALSGVEDGTDSFVASGSAVVYFLSRQQALLLMQIHSLHGLANGSPLIVNTTARSSGTLAQTINESSGIITIETTAVPSLLAGDPGSFVDDLAAIHGLTAPLVVAANSRVAGSINQTIVTMGSTTTVSRS
jgi:hypothetical protein